MFQPGQSGNPRGRPKGHYGGRIQALATLDRIMAKKANRARRAEALEAEFEKNPVAFFKSIIMPLLPRDALVTLQRDGAIRWQSLLGVAEATLAQAAAAGQEVPGPVLQSGGA